MPTYEPLLGAASFLGADIKRFDRDAEHGFALDLDTVAAAISERTRLIVITNLHNPSSALADEDDLPRIRRARRARSNARILIDEVYLDCRRPAAAKRRPLSAPSSSAPTASPRSMASAACAAAGSSPSPRLPSGCGG